MESKVKNTKTHKLDPLIDEIWKGILSSRIVPIELLETKAFGLLYKTTPNGHVLTDIERKQVQQILLSKLEKRYGSYMSATNIIQLLSRMKKHFRAYGRYNPKFVLIIKNSTRKQRLGVVYRVSNANNMSFSKLNGPVFNATTSTTSILRALTQGQVIKVTTKSGADDEQFTNEVESYDTYDSKLAIPKLGFSEIRFSSSLPNEVLSQLEGWVTGFFAFMVDVMPILSHGASLEGYVVRRTKMLVRTAVANPATYTLDMRISHALHTMLQQECSKKNMPKIIYDGSVLTLNYGEKSINGVLSPNWFNVIIMTCMTVGTRGLTIPNDATFELILGEIVNERETGFSSLIEKFKKEKYIIIIGDKGSGKTTLANTLMMTPYASEIHIEDSDDWGMWLTYILTKATTASDVEDLANTMTEAEAIQSVVEFYSLSDDERSVYKSYWKLLAEKAVTEFLQHEYAVGGISTQVTSLLLESVIRNVLPLIEMKMLSLIIYDKINQRIFERGVKNYMTKAMKTIQVSMLHSIMDSAKRSPPCALLKLVTPTNSLASISIRALNNGSDVVSFLAENVLFTLYNRMRDTAAQMVSIGTICKLFDFVPVVNEKLDVAFLNSSGGEVTHAKGPQN